MLIQRVQLDNIDAFILVPGSTAIYGLCDTFNRVIARSSLVTEWPSPILRPDPCGIQVFVAHCGRQRTQSS